MARRSRGTKAQRQQALHLRWAELMAVYRRRHRQWVMEVMPSMPDDQWKLYTQWVAEFGAANIDQTAHHGRKVRRQLRAARLEASKFTLRKDANMYATPTEIDALARQVTGRRDGKSWSLEMLRRWHERGQKAMLPPTVTMRRTTMPK